jgi:hypothetical protein
MRCPPHRPQRSSPDSSAAPSLGAPGAAAVCRLAAIRAMFASYSCGVIYAGRRPGSSTSHSLASFTTRPVSGLPGIFLRGSTCRRP